MLFLTSPLFLFKWNSTLLPGTGVVVWDRLESPLVNILFMTKLLSLDPLSWDTYCLLNLWPSSSLVPLVTVTVHLVFWSLSLTKNKQQQQKKTLLILQSTYTHKKIIKTPLLHHNLGPRVFLSLSLSLADSLKHRDLSCSLSCPGF